MAFLRIAVSLSSVYILYTICSYVLLAPENFAQKAYSKPHGHSSSTKHEGSRQPNIVFILTDDQDLHMSSLDYMQNLQNHLVKQGTYFNHHYCTVALCCPSRVSLWTGKHAHNTNVTDVNPPHGGYPKFVTNGFNDAYLPLWLQTAGYDTYYIGKLFNAQSTSNYNKPYPRGWNGSDFLLDPFTYEYLNATMQRNIELWDEVPVHEEPRSYEGHYSTDVIAAKSYAFLDVALTQRYESNGSGRPFFLTIAPTAPHSNVHIHEDLSGGGGKYKETTATQSPPIPAERHKHLFKDVVVPRTPDFNPDLNNTVSWLKSLPRQNQTNLDLNDHFYRQRLRSLQAVDEMIPEIIMKLEYWSALEETYIVFTTDNGYHIGQHRLQPGKQCAYETDINVPMIVRGPEVLAGRIETKISSHVDLASTFLSLAGIDSSISGPKYALDGDQMVFHAFPGSADDNATNMQRVIPDSTSTDIQSQFYAQSTSSKGAQKQHQDLRSLKRHEYRSGDLGSNTEHVNIEMWGIIMPEGKYGTILYPNHTYKALRILSQDDSYNLLYIVWCTNEHELYDLRTDPYALENLLASQMKSKSDIVFGANSDSSMPAKNRYTLDQVVARLDALMLVLKSCKERQCTHPWDELHETGHINNLADALSEEHDKFYMEDVPKVTFDRCEQAYMPEIEGAMWPLMT